MARSQEAFSPENAYNIKMYTPLILYRDFNSQNNIQITC